MIINFFLGIWGRIAAVVTAIVGIFAVGYWKGKRQERNKITQEKYEEVKEQVKEDKRKQAIEDKAYKQAQEVQNTDTTKDVKKYNAGKWLLVFVFVPYFALSCTKRVEYIQSTCPQLRLLQRPDLRYIEIYPEMILDNQSFEDLVYNLEALKNTIKAYEIYIGTYNGGINVDAGK